MANGDTAMKNVAAIWKRLLRRIGHRGLFLLTLGLFDIFNGLFLLLGGQLQFPLQLSNYVWGWIWIGVGAFLITGAFFKRDSVFFAAAVLVKTAWALEYIRLSYISGTLQWPRAAYWTSFAVIVLVVSAWPEPRTDIIAEETVTRAESIRDNGGGNS
jgi:hypothetical protein